MMPNNVIPTTQPSHQAVLRQPVIYIALPAQQKPPISHTCSSVASTANAVQATGQPDSRQLCTCPPEVHKALLEGQIPGQPRERTDGEFRPVTLQVGLHNLRALVPANATLQLATASSGRSGHLSTGNSISMALPPEGVTTSAMTIPTTTGGSTVRLPSGAHWILVPTSSLVLATSTTSSGGTHASVLTASTTTSSPATANLAMTSSMLNSVSSAISMSEQKPPPDVLLTSTNSSTAADHVRAQSNMPEASRLRLACMEGQLAHLSAWVQVLQQSPGTQVNAKQLAGYSHRNCANNTCRMSTDAPNPTDRDSNYTPSNSSLDSAYSARSTTSSESISTKQHNLNPESQQQQQQQVSAHIPVIMSSDNEPLTSPTNPLTVHSPPTHSVSMPQTGALAPDYCPLFALPNYSALIDHPVSTKNNLPSIKTQLKSAQSELITLKSELSGLRRAQTACMAQHKEAAENALERIKQMIAKVDGLDLGLIQRARLTTNRQLNIYENEARKANAWLKDLDSTIEDLRMVALTRRCRISVSEVEMLALHVNRISFRLRNFKDELPKLSDRLQSVIDAEMRQINRNKEFIENELGRIEEALARCKQLTSTLFTLKRLGSVQQNSTSDNIPNVRTVREPTAAERRHLFERIASIQPDHEARVNSIRTFEDLRSFRELIKDPEVTQSFEQELIFPDDVFTFPETPPCSPGVHQLKTIGFSTLSSSPSCLSSQPVLLDNEVMEPDSATDLTTLTRDDSRTQRRVRPSPHAIRYVPTPQRELSFYMSKHYKHPDDDEAEEEEEDDDDDDDDVLVDGVDEEGFLGDTYIGASHFIDTYNQKLTLHSQDNLVPTEPISITQDPLVSLASPPKSQLRESPNILQKEPFRGGRNGPSPGSAAPTILKRAQSTLSASSSSSATATATSTLGITTKSSLNSSRANQSVSTRRSRVVFSRTVLVGNGSETIQLNCPSETDDEEDRRRQVFRPTGNFSVDDLVINRTSQPWIQARKPDGKSTKELIYPSRSVKSRTKNANRRLYRPLNESSYRNYQEHSVNGLPVPVIKPVQTSHSNQQHHHNCQAARQVLKTVSSGTTSAQRDTM